MNPYQKKKKSGHLSAREGEAFSNVGSHSGQHKRRREVGFRLTNARKIGYKIKRKKNRKKIFTGNVA